MGTVTVFKSEWGDAVLIAQIAALTLLMGNNRMGEQNDDGDRAILAELKARGANIEEVNGDITVYRALTDDMMQLAARLECLTRLRIPFVVGDRALSGTELRHLKGHKKLRELDITRQPIPGEHLNVLTALPKLEVLRCTPKVNPKDALVNIGKCKGLRVLSLHEAKVADDCLQGLEGLENLEDLELSGNPVSSGIRAVASMKQLRELNLGDTRVDDAALGVLLELKSLDNLFVGSPKLTNSSVETIAKCKGIRTLGITSPQITADGVAHLVGLKELKYLDLRVGLTDETICQTLGKMGQLKDLICSERGISPGAKKRLETLLPGCDILWIEKW